MPLIGVRSSSPVLATNLLTYGTQGWRTPVNINANRTVHNVFALEDDFDLVRVAFLNDTGSTYAIGASVIAAVGSVNVAGNYAPIDAAGAAVSWTSITFDGGGAAADPLVAAGSTTTLTVPAATVNVGDAQQVIPAIAWSDWIRVSSIPPADGSRFRYLAVRTFNGAATTSRGASNNAGATWEGVSRGRIISAAQSVGDLTAAAQMTSPSVTTQGIPALIQTYSRRRGITIMGVGDSITQGFDTIASNNCWGHVARAILSTPERPITWVNLGHGGSTSINYYRRAIAMLPIVRPHIAAYSVWTPNDTQDNANADLAWSRAMDFVGRCNAQGTRPVLFAPPRWYTGAEGAAETVRQRILSRIASIRNVSGLPILEPDIVLGSTRDSFSQELIYSIGPGNRHPNDFGHETLGVEFAQIVRDMLAVDGP
jgi:hypothetical protein